MFITVHYIPENTHPYFKKLVFGAVNYLQSELIKALAL